MQFQNLKNISELKLPSASIIASNYPSSTPVLDAKASTSLASALRSVRRTFRDSDKYTSAERAIYSAAPASVQSSISVSGYAYENIITQLWYSSNVPKSVQSVVSNQMSAVSSAGQAIITKDEAKSTSSSSAAGARITALGVAGVVGVVGGVFAAAM